MKTSSLFLITALLLFPFCMNSLFGQQKSNNEVEKKITIIKRTINADGTEITETIVKKGKAAENFDVDQYVRENGNGAEVQVQVQETTGDESRNKTWNKSYPAQINISSCDNKRAFLGVEEDSDEDEDQPGLVVQIIRGTGAEKAGLRHNDKILQINGVKTDRWSDLTKFIDGAKAGDKVKISYDRNGTVSTTEATLTTRSQVKSDGPAPVIGFMGIYSKDYSDEPGATVAVVTGSGAEKAGLADNDVIVKINNTPIADYEDITDLLAYTKPGEKLNITYRRNGAEKTAEVLLTEPQKNTYNAYNIPSPGFDIKRLDDGAVTCTPKVTCNIKEKEACLGVYSSDGKGNGAEIESFTTESAAREAGMKESDLILSVNGQAVNGHSQLWDEIAKYKTGDKVEVAYQREGQKLQVQATLKACRNTQSRVEVLDTDGNPLKHFFAWDWTDNDQRRLRETRIIIIRRAGEGDGAKVNAAPADRLQPQDRSLQLRAFKAFPNPSQGPVTVEFSGEAVPTVVSLFDAAGRQLFREELNAFNGEYSQQFDLSAYAKGAVVIQVQQGEAVYTEQIVVN